MSIKILGYSTLLCCGIAYADNPSTTQIILDYRTALYQTTIDVKSYVGKWSTDCSFDQEQQDYAVEYFEFANPFLLKQTKQVFKNHICTIPRISYTTEEQVKHLSKQGNSINLHVSPSQKITISISPENTYQMVLQLENGTSYKLTKSYK